jgi:hypothetical protein
VKEGKRDEGNVRGGKKKEYKMKKRKEQKREPDLSGKSTL